MYAVIRRFNIYEGTTNKIIQRVNEGFLPMISKMRGFVSYHLIDGGDGIISSMSVFEDRQGAEEFTHVANEWVRKNLANVIKTAPVILTGVVAAHGERPGGGITADRRPSAATAPGANPSEARR
jgi:hypothetical protein